MTCISLKRLFSSVSLLLQSSISKTLSSALLTVLVWSPSAQSQTTITSCPSVPQPTCSEGETPKALKQTPCKDGGVSVTEWSCSVSCSFYKSSLTASQIEASKACSEAGLGSLGSCIKKMRDCSDPELIEGTSSDFMSAVTPLVNQAATAYGVPLNLPIGGSKTVKPGKCSAKGSTDYFESKDRIDRELTAAQKDISEIKTKLSEAQRDFNETKQDLVKEANEAQKDLSEQKNELSKEKLSQQAEQQRAQSETMEQIRVLNKQLLEKRGEIANTEQKFVQRLASMTRELAQTECLAKTKELRDKLKTVFGADFGSQSRKVKTLQENFDNCLKQFEMQRLELESQRTNYFAIAQNDLKNIQEQINEANQSLEASAKLSAEALTNMATRENEITQQAIQAVQASSNAISDAAANLQQQQMNLGLEQSEITSRINSLNQQLEMLGPTPSPGAKTGWYEAQTALISYHSKIASAESACASESGSISSHQQYKKDIERAVNKGSSRSSRSQK